MTYILPVAAAVATSLMALSFGFAFFTGAWSSGETE